MVENKLSSEYKFKIKWTSKFKKDLKKAKKRKLDFSKFGEVVKNLQKVNNCLNQIKIIN